VPQPLEADFEVDPELAEAGNQLFNRDSIEGICWYCHGGGAIVGGAAPDLRASAAVLDAEAFDRIVRGGALTDAGMPAFADLTDGELESLRHYVRRQAEVALGQAP
jgi:quinohemoprotein ethanol dehydrogenase